MNISTIFMYISITATFIPLLLGLWKYREYNTVFKILSIYTIWGVLGEIAGLILALTIQTTIFEYNIYIFVESALIMLIYYKLFQSKQAQNTILGLGFLVLTYKIYSTIVAPNGLNTPEDTFRTAVSFIIITSALYLFYQILKNYDSQTSLYKNPVFWLNSAFLLYFMTNIFTFMIRDFMVREIGTVLINSFTVIHSIANILMNLLLAFSFWLCRTEKK